jgi:chromosome segregation ATPase
LDELLTIERKITGDLRFKNIQLMNEIDIFKKNNTAIKKYHRETLKKNAKSLMKLNNQQKELTAEIKQREQKNIQLKNDIKTLATEVVRLRKQINILKENRYRSKLRTN